ncbi:polyketide cyclase / dehydrase and lipid transport [Rhodococcus erythropolis]|uniref:polyketide cyclase / dehydrase and lipid transport n=1 Tax=Rhodococcus TaxID=1827 RepID=UPI001A2F78BD|nr:polyketide cyclase / dehydrase and lipid transport [Rhodococcus sp. (in: high G+C Gram-positive bacteria)]MBJ7479850.1 polyketide cyclase / dehydrase and lipid transport [Rhodococcus sp. (in: high G+C Gram-positive bacteria)]
MSSIQVADQTFIAAPPERVAELLSSRAQWRRWFSDLALEVREDRGPAGFRWGVSGQLVGTMEVWLEPVMDGTITHYFLHCEPVGVSPSDLANLDLAGMNRKRRVDGKVMSFQLKRELEAGRAAGVAPD